MLLRCFFHGNKIARRQRCLRFHVAIIYSLRKQPSFFATRAGSEEGRLFSQATLFTAALFFNARKGKRERERVARGGRGGEENQTKNRETVVIFGKKVDLLLHLGGKLLV